MIKIRFNFEEKRAVAYDNELEVGECNFICENDTWNIIHTIVIDKYKGQGIGKKLVECVIENAKKHDIKLKADCSYAYKIIFC